MNEYFYDYLKTLIPESRISLEEPMENHTTFRVGGAADYFIRPEGKEELSALIRYFNLAGRDYIVMGNGSNLLVGDHGYRGVIIQLLNKEGDIEIEGTTLTAAAGTLLSSVAQKAMEAGLSGFEFASGIPGTVGGAMVMNAGAYGGEMADIVTEVEVIAPDGEAVTLRNPELKFGYRTSIFKSERFAAVKTVFSLKEGDREEIRARMKELNERRRSKQPLEFASAGSTFKRPEGHYAGKLIMDAGLSGMTIGGAKVSEKHCGFIINTGTASAADILDLMHEVQEKVLSRFGVKLEPEVYMLGEF